MTTKTEPVQAPPSNVIAALARVQFEIGGIEKLTPAQRKKLGISGGSEDGKGITYAYRGIDQVTAAAQPLFGEYGIVIAPGKIVSHDVEIVTVGQNKNEWDNVTMLVRWSIYGPGGGDDMIEAETLGEGRDNSDKGVNKAYTGAYKNLMLKLLSIGDPSEDPDTERFDNTDNNEPAADLSLAQEAATRVSKLSGADKALVTKLAKEAGINNIMRAGDRADELLDIIDNLHAGQPASEPKKEEEH